MDSATVLPNSTQSIVRPGEMRIVSQNSASKAFDIVCFDLYLPGERMFFRSKSDPAQLVAPSKVRQGNLKGSNNEEFVPEIIVHDEGDDGFSVAVGRMQTGSYGCGVRFNGHGSEEGNTGAEAGFPYVPSSTGIRARWFVVPSWLTEAIVDAAIEEKRRLAKSVLKRPEGRTVQARGGDNGR